MDFNMDSMMGGMSPPREQLEPNQVSNRGLSPETSAQLSTPQENPVDLESTITTSLASEEPLQPEEDHWNLVLAGNQHLGDTDKLAEPFSDKSLESMTWVELVQFFIRLPPSDSRRQHAYAEVKHRPDYLEFRKSTNVAHDDEHLSDNQALTQLPNQFAFNFSTTPAGPPPSSVYGLPRNLLPPSAPPVLMPALTNSQRPRVRRGSRSLAKAERLIEEALPLWDAYKLVKHEAWQPPVEDPWKIPSPPGVATPTSYVVPPEFDVTLPGDHTSFVAEQAWLSADNLPPAMGYIDFVPDQRRGVGHTTRHALGQFTKIRLPLVISQQVEGWRIAYWLRCDRDITIRDIIARLYWLAGRVPMTDLEMQQWRNALSMRHQRWSNEVGGFMFPKPGSKEHVSLKQVEIIERALRTHGFEGLERNMLWGLDTATGMMVQPNPRNVNHSSRSKAPERSALRPRVEAAFQKYMMVVNAAKFRGLSDWRALDKSFWENKEKNNKAAKPFIGQSTTKDGKNEADDDVEFLYEKPLAPMATLPKFVLPLRSGNSAQHDNWSGPSTVSNGLPFNLLPFGSAGVPSTATSLGHEGQERRPQHMPSGGGPVHHPAFLRKEMSTPATYEQQNGFYAQAWNPDRPQPANAPDRLVINRSVSVSTPGTVHAMRPAVATPTMAPVGSLQLQVENGEIELKQFDAKQIRDQETFIADQQRIYDHFRSQGFWGGAQGTQAAALRSHNNHLLEQYTAAQRRNRENLIREQATRRRAFYGFRQGGENSGHAAGFNGVAVRQQTIRQTSAHKFNDSIHGTTPPPSAPNVTHTPPSSPAAPQSKRQRAASVDTNGLSANASRMDWTEQALEKQQQGGDNLTVTGLPFAIQDAQIATTTQSSRPPEPAMRKIEIDENYDDEDDDEMDGEK